MKIHVLVLALITVCCSQAYAYTSSEIKTTRYLTSIKNNSQQLSKFMNAMPKGGDLHNHESGATYAENLIHYAANDNLCVDRKTFIVSQTPECEKTNLLNNAITDINFYDSIIDAWSMQHFTRGKESGHDHFFATFGKFGYIANHHRGEVLAEITDRAGTENESYLELMVTADGNASGKLGKKLGWNPDFSQMRQKLLSADFDKIITSITTSIAQDEKDRRRILACDTNHPKPGCQVKVRYLYQVLREQAPEMVFAQLLAGFEAATKDNHVVGLNMVQPEDGKLSMRDYKLHMQMVGYLHQLYPDVLISLHAGELNEALVPAEGLKFHINDAVTIASANRIGHGVDIMNEDKVDTLLTAMAQKHIMVEINLSSNAMILGVEGKQHPLPTYMKYGVPVALSTDDEGVSRSNLTKEYKHAVQTFGFDYLTLKHLVRNSLMYAFLPGKALWSDYAYHQPASDCAADVLGSDKPSYGCQAFLNNNEKASLQWDLENRFTRFEQHYS